MGLIHELVSSFIHLDDPLWKLLVENDLQFFCKNVNNFLVPGHFMIDKRTNPDVIHFHQLDFVVIEIELSEMKFFNFFYKDVGFGQNLKSMTCMFQNIFYFFSLLQNVRIQPGFYCGLLEHVILELYELECERIILAEQF